VGPENHVLNRGSRSPKGSCPPRRKELGDFAAVYAKTTELIEMPFGADLYGFKEARVRWRLLQSDESICHREG